MAWTHDTGYRPAYDHTGYPVAIQDDGTEALSTSGPTRPDVIGWRAACDCGWRGMTFFPRREHPGATALAPDAVDGSDTGTAAYAEWDRHLHRVLPELAVHDRAQELRVAEQRLNRAIHAARFAGLTWLRIEAVAGRPRTAPARRHEIDGHYGTPWPSSTASELSTVSPARQQVGRATHSTGRDPVLHLRRLWPDVAQPCDR